MRRKNTERIILGHFFWVENTRLIILQETNKSDKKEAHLSSFYLAFSTISSAVPVQSGSSFAFFSYEIL